MVEKYHFKKVWWPARPPLPKWQMSQKSFLFNPLLTIQQAHRNFFWKGAARWQNSVKQNLLTMLLILRMVLRKALAIALSFVSRQFGKSLTTAFSQFGERLSCYSFRHHCRLNICSYIGWIDKYSICKIKQYNCKCWDGNAVYHSMVLACWSQIGYLIWGKH